MKATSSNKGNPIWVWGSGDLGIWGFKVGLGIWGSGSSNFKLRIIMKFATTLAVLLMPLVAIAQKKSVRLAVAEFWRNSTAIDQVSSGDLSAVRSTLQMLLEDNFLGTVQEMKELKIAQFPVVMRSAPACLSR